MTPLRLPSSAAAAACRSSDSGREHGFGAPRLPALRFVRTASGSERPRPRLQRHAPRLGGFIRDRGAPRSPRGHKNPRGSRLAVCSLSLHRTRCDPSCHRRGVCPHDIATTAIAALDCAFQRPRRRQPTTLPVAALWMAAPYHAVTRAARTIFLSIPLPPLAARPLLTPVTTRSPHAAPRCRPGSDRRQARRSTPEPPSSQRRIGRIAAGRGRHTGPRASPVPLPPRHRRRAWPERHAQGLGRDRCEADRRGGACHRLGSQRSFAPAGGVTPAVLALPTQLSSGARPLSPRPASPCGSRRRAR